MSDRTRSIVKLAEEGQRLLALPPTEGGTVSASTIVIDPHVLIARLAEHGVSASLDASGTEAQIYFNSHRSALLIGKTGDLAEVTWDITGGVEAEREVAQVSSLDEAVHEVRQWHYQHGLQERAQALMDYIQEEVPPTVMHYAVEDAKDALRTLLRNANDINFMHGREV